MYSFVPLQVALKVLGLELTVSTQTVAEFLARYSSTGGGGDDLNQDRLHRGGDHWFSADGDLNIDVSCN
ncbi:unnamed protein product [Hymenolepis diminuta]|uniref:Secreted protein n=1 Tax=Hymenolepis diminuta TaxID=6216 RepID=A0A0R3SJ56_HYMDI|nr:unnamed protein product [Hymenolepis diminuta]